MLQTHQQIQQHSRGASTGDIHISNHNNLQLLARWEGLHNLEALYKAAPASMKVFQDAATAELRVRAEWQLHAQVAP